METDSESAWTKSLDWICSISNICAWNKQGRWKWDRRRYNAWWKGGARGCHFGELSAKSFGQYLYCALKSSHSSPAHDSTGLVPTTTHFSSGKVPSQSRQRAIWRHWWIKYLVFLQRPTHTLVRGMTTTLAIYVAFTPTNRRVCHRHYPVGLLYDIYQMNAEKKGQKSTDCSPILNIAVHLTDPPNTLMPLQSTDLFQQTFFAIYKEVRRARRFCPSMQYN